MHGLIASAAATADSLVAIKIIGGFVALLVLAYLGGHRRVVAFERRLGISSAIAAGAPFVVLGLIASHEDVGILTGDVLTRMQPLLQFGLGWLGFIIGSQLDIRVLDKVPRGTAYIILVEAAVPFALTAAATGLIMLGYGRTLDDPTLWRDVVILGGAAAMTAPRLFRGFANRAWRAGRSVDVLIAQLDEIVGVIGLLFITAYFRTDANVAWQLPGTAWIFVALGLGVVIGVLIFAMIRVPVSSAEFLAVVVGAIAFASGLARYLHLSPLVVCFLAGVLVVNFPNEQRASVFRILFHLERPVHQLFLIVSGALWYVNDWRGWVMVPAFVLARTVGKFLGVKVARGSVGFTLPSGFNDDRHIVSPLSSLSIGLVISAATIYPESTLPWTTTAVIGAAFFTEILVQLTGGNVDAPPSMLTGATRVAATRPSTLDIDALAPAPQPREAQTTGALPTLASPYDSGPVAGADATATREEDV